MEGFVECGLEIFEFSLSKSGMRTLSVEVGGEGEVGVRTLSVEVGGEGEVGGRGEVREKRQGKIGELH